MPAFTAYLPSEVLSIPLLSQNAKNTGTWPRSSTGSPARCLRGSSAGSAHAIDPGGGIGGGRRGPLRQGWGRSPLRGLPHRVHGGQELLVALRLLQLVEQELHRLHRIELGQRLAEQPDLLQLVLLQQQLFLAGA